MNTITSEERGLPGMQRAIGKASAAAAKQTEESGRKEIAAKTFCDPQLWVVEEVVIDHAHTCRMQRLQQTKSWSGPDVEKACRGSSSKHQASAKASTRISQDAGSHNGP